MHEQFHEQSMKADSTGETIGGDAPRQPSFAQAVEKIAAPMRRLAFQEPCLSHTDLNLAIQSGKFARLIPINNTFGIGVLLTVSPGDDDALDEVFWHCSMSIVSLSSHRPKSRLLWTRVEELRIRKLLAAFFAPVGFAGTEQFVKTKTALHLQKDLTQSEFEKLSAEDE